MSKLKEKLSRKIRDQLGIECVPDDILFEKNGPRGDVVRWSIFGYECFTSGGFCVSDNIGLKLADEPQGYGITEIYAVDV